MNGNNQWILWVVGAGVLLYWLAQSNATSAANASQTGVPPGSRVAGSTVYNAQGGVIGSITSQGNFIPSIISGSPASTTSSSPTGMVMILPAGVSSNQALQNAMGIHCPAGQQLVDVGDIVPAYVCQ